MVDNIQLSTFTVYIQNATFQINWLSTIKCNISDQLAFYNTFQIGKCYISDFTMVKVRDSGLEEKQIFDRIQLVVNELNVYGTLKSLIFKRRQLKLYLHLRLLQISKKDCAMSKKYIRDCRRK